MRMGFSVYTGLGLQPTVSIPLWGCGPPRRYNSPADQLGQPRPDSAPHRLAWEPECNGSRSSTACCRSDDLDRIQRLLAICLRDARRRIPSSRTEVHRRSIATTDGGRGKKSLPSRSLDQLSPGGDSTSSIQVKAATARGKPSVVTAKYATWRIASGSTPALSARRTWL